MLFFALTDLAGNHPERVDQQPLPVAGRTPPFPGHFYVLHATAGFHARMRDSV